MLAAVDDSGTEPVAVIRALREQTASLEARVRALGDERTLTNERAAAEHAAVDFLHPGGERPTQERRQICGGARARAPDALARVPRAETGAGDSGRRCEDNAATCVTLGVQTPVL